MSTKRVHGEDTQQGLSKVNVGGIAYWIDKNMNTWSRLRYTQGQAERLSKTLQNCTWCYDCYECVDCNHCDRCHACKDCSYCTACHERTTCGYSSFCRNSKQLKRCHRCDECSDLDESTQCRRVTASIRNTDPVFPATGFHSVDGMTGDVLLRIVTPHKGSVTVDTKGALCHKRLFSTGPRTITLDNSGAITFEERQEATAINSESRDLIQMVKIFLDCLNRKGFV